MARNVEIEARIAGVEAPLTRAAALATEGPMEIRQDDGFVRCEAGGLKLGAFSPGRGELVVHRRASSP